MSTLIDSNVLRKAIEDFQFRSKPSNGDSSANCTIEDINKVINQIADTMTIFVDEIEKSQ